LVDFYLQREQGLGVFAFVLQPGLFGFSSGGGRRGLELFAVIAKYLLGVTGFQRDCCGVREMFGVVIVEERGGVEIVGGFAGK
jgi:hypothetical protein